MHPQNTGRLTLIPQTPSVCPEEPPYWRSNTTADHCALVHCRPVVSYTGGEDAEL